MGAGLADGPLPGRAHRDRHGLDPVVTHALVVPGRLERLDVAVGIGRAAGELMLSGLGVPVERPATPRELAERRLEARLGPGAIHGDLDAPERRPTTPCPAVERHPSGIHETTAGEVVRD